MSSLILSDIQEKELVQLVEYLQKVINDNINLLNLSKDKDIVVALGNTGSGKSTTLNLLAGKELIVGQFDSIVLKNESDPTAMKIGSKCESMTKCPFSVQVGDLLLIDLPGFRDSGGMSCDLANAAFIKAILEEANSVKVMLFVGEDEITASRGEFLKDMLTGTGKMFGKVKELLLDSSILVVTKSTRKNVDELGEFLLKSVPPQYHGFLHNWIYKKALFQIKKPNGNQVCQDGKTEILTALSSCPGQKVTHVDIGAIYPSGVEAELLNIFRVIFDKELNSFLPKPDGKLSSITSAINTVKGNSQNDDHFREFWERFIAHLESVNAVKVLKPLSETSFTSALKYFQESKLGTFSAIISDWKSQYEVVSKKTQDEFVSRIQVVCEEQAMNQRRNNAYNSVDDISSAEKKRDSIKQALMADMKPVFLDAIKSDPELESIVRRDPGYNQQIFEEAVRDFSGNDLTKIISDIQRELQKNIELYDSKISELKTKEEIEKAQSNIQSLKGDVERVNASLTQANQKIGQLTDTINSMDDDGFCLIQ